MNIVCVICSDRLTPSDDVFFTPCGHIFHFACLTQWLERSRTCPQCREKVTQNRIHRIYFNYCNNETIVEDATTLQATVDSLKFQVMVKDREIKAALAKYSTSKIEAAGLRAEVRKLEGELTHKDTAILALKEQTRFFKNLSTEAENAKKEVARLKNKIDEYKTIQTLISAPSEDIDDMISNTRDPAKLVTYILVMKRELSTSVARRRELRAALKKTQQDLTAVSMERNFLLGEHEKRKELEDLLAVAEMEKRSLEDRLKELEGGGARPQQSERKDRLSATVETADGESARSREKKTHEPGESSSPKRGRVRREGDIIEIMSSPEAVRGDEENSPQFFSYVLSSRAARNKRPPQLTGSSSYGLLAKKPRLAQSDGTHRPMSELAFDGFGGHSKTDKFPSPKKFGGEAKRSSRGQVGRRNKLDDGSNKKLGDFLESDQ